MTDIDEQTLVRDLQCRPLPAAQSDIGRRSVALARRMRRRRRGAAVGVLVALALVVGVALGGGTQFGRLGPEPATSLSPRVDNSDLSPADLTSGPAPTVDYVHDGRWVPADGRTVALADPGSLLTGRGDAFVALDGGLLAVRDLDQGPAERLGYSRDDGPPARVPGVGPRVLEGAQPGPNGSVLISAVGGYAVAHADGTWSFAKHFGDPAAGAPPVVAAKTSVFHAVAVGSTTVVRRSELDPKVPVVDNEGWTRAVISDPASDRIVLADERGCRTCGCRAPG